jgi:tripartite-type tricarboxylate transporter receptor subunit TctC
LKAGLAAALLALPVAVLAQAYPVKPIRMVVPYPPGGIDPYFRIMTPKLQELLGQPIIVENRPGANGIIGTEAVVKSPADGYTLLFATTSTLVGGTLMLKSVTFDPVKDLTPIIGLFESMRTVTVAASLPINSIKELIDYAKANPGKLSFGSSGIGSAFHLDGEVLKEAAGINIVHVPYKGSAPMATAITSGEIGVGVASYNNVMAAINAGKVRLLAVMEKKRSPLLPNVPTVAETLPGTWRTVGWTGILGPAALPRPIVERWNSAARAAMETPEVRAHHQKMGTVITMSTPEETAESLHEGLKFVSALMKKIGLEAQ